MYSIEITDVKSKFFNHTFKSQDFIRKILLLPTLK